MEEECPVCFRENPRLMFECLHCGDQFCQGCSDDHECLSEPIEE